MKTSLIGICLSLLPLCGISQQLNSKITPQGILISQGDQKILFYQKETKCLDGDFPRSNYIHPLYDLDGNIITEDFPEDHKHHRGIFWAWHQVLVAGKPMGDSWECSNFNWDVKQAVTKKINGKLQLNTKTFWSSPDFIENGNQVPLIEENTKITIHPVAEKYRIIDFKITLLALTDDVQIGGSNDVKGYGGFSARLKLPKDVQFTSQGKKITPKNEAVQSGRMMQITGNLTPNQKLGVFMISSTRNPKPNNSWILRSKNSMQNAVYPGSKAVNVSKKSPTILRYRLVIYKGNPTQDQLELWKDF